MSSPTDDALTRFKNCRLLRDHRLVTVDLWVRAGRIVDPEKVFFDEHRQPDRTIECGAAIIAPGFIDLQINGGFGYDFANNIENVAQGVAVVAKSILAHGVTSFCPTVITSHPDTYQSVLPHIPKRPGGEHGATVLGVHVEGPFINVEKKGAHPPKFICDLDEGIETMRRTYGSLDNVRIVTLAPEKPEALAVIEELTRRGITAAVGHSMANLVEGEAAVRSGSNLITHLFNAMLPFHHRDPGLVGLLTSDAVPPGRTVFFGIIADGCHTHPAALRIAHRAHPQGLILVTDAISALGLPAGIHYLGELKIEVRDGRGLIAGTDTMCGSIASLDECVRIFRRETGCSIEYALEAASLHPAQCLAIDDRKGTLDFGADADFVMLSDGLEVLSTWIAGECVYRKVST